MRRMKILISIFVFIGLGLSSVLVCADQKNEMMSNILSSLSDDEVVIECAYYKKMEDEEIPAISEQKSKEKIIKEKKYSRVNSCLSKFKINTRGFASSQSTQGILSVAGKVIEKSDDYVIFEVNLEFKSETRMWEINSARVKLTNGQEIIIGGLKNSSTGNWKITMKAIW